MSDSTSTTAADGIEVIRGEEVPSRLMQHDESVTAVEVISSAITAAEREFSIRVGLGEVQGGEFLDNADKARAIVNALATQGFAIVKTSES